MNRFTCMFIVLLSVGAVASAADALVHRRSGVRLSIPKGWQNVSTADDSEPMILVADSGEAAIFLYETSGHDSKKFFQDIPTELAENLKDSRVEKVTARGQLKAEKVKSLTRYTKSGTATFDGQPAEWELSLVVGGKSSLVLLVTGNVTKHRKTLDQLYASLSK